MKTFQTLSKNLKLLFRSKETAFTIIFGPLLIILLVGFAFTSSEDITVSLGVYSDEYTPLADDIIQSLNGQDYLLNILSSHDECVNLVKTGEIHVCLIFPPNFVVEENKTNIVEFNVDPSRINLVYSLIDQLSTEFSIQSAALSEELTNEILARVTATKEVLKEQAANADAVQKLREEAIKPLQDSGGQVNTEGMNVSIIDLKMLRGRATGLSSDATQLHTHAVTIVDDAIKQLHSAKNKVGDNASIEAIEAAIDRFEEAQIEIDAIFEETPNKLEDIYYQIDSASKAITNLEEGFEGIQEKSDYVNEQIALAVKSLDSMKRKLTEMKGSLTYTYELLDSIEVAEASSIVSPIQTAINPVTLEEDNLTFTYPYVLMLVIMFMGLMLGSTLIVVDKTSHAAFRNFTTSTRDEFHIFMSYLTTLLVLLAQVFIILLFSYFLVSTPLLNNFSTSIFIILISISLWSFLGMIIGYLSNNQESSMIACLTIGSISLFISNLVIPIEGMNQFIRVFTYVNPYVVLSEMLKKSMLFNIPTGGFGGQLLMMIGVVFALFIAIILAQRYMKKRYFSQMRSVEVKAVKKAVTPLEIFSRPVKDEFQLLTALDLMTRADFQKLVTEENNPIYIWVRDEIGDKKLAGKLKTTSKERMIIALDKRLKQMTRKSIRKK